MRNYSRIEEYLDRLITEIYPQPQDPGHTAWAQESIEYFCNGLDAKFVLDMGCGEAFCQPMFEEKGYDYIGVCLGKDFQVAFEKGRKVLERDFTFTGFPNDWADLIYSRHSLEHSFSPLLTLMEWYRVTKKYLAVVVPSAEFWDYKGQNHYYVLNEPQWLNLFDKTGFDVKHSYSKRQNMTTDIHRPEVEIEMWFLLEKK